MLGGKLAWVHRFGTARSLHAIQDSRFKPNAVSHLWMKTINWWWFCSQEDPFSKADENLEALSKDARRWVKQIYPIATSFVLHHAHHTHIYSIKILRSYAHMLIWSYAHMCAYSLCMCLCILITTPFVHAQAYWYTFFWNMFLYWMFLWMWTNAFCPATFLSPGKAAFERDCLQFARDVATVGQLYEADIRSESFGCITWWYSEVVLRNPTSLNTEPKQLQHFVSFSCMELWPPGIQDVNAKPNHPCCLNQVTMNQSWTLMLKEKPSNSSQSSPEEPKHHWCQLGEELHGEQLKLPRRLAMGRLRCHPGYGEGL